jgi:hypothetical protein
MGENIPQPLVPRLLNPQPKEKNMNLVPFDIKDRIKEIYNNSDSLIKRIRVVCKNGMQISVVSSPYAFCDKERPFEIAILDKNGNFVKTKNDDEVEGFCTEVEVCQTIRRVATIL